LGHPVDRAGVCCATLTDGNQYDDQNRKSGRRQRVHATRTSLVTWYHLSLSYVEQLESGRCLPRTRRVLIRI